MRRRDLITLVGATVAWPRAVRSQQQLDRIRLIGMLTLLSYASEVVLLV